MYCYYVLMSLLIPGSCWSILIGFTLLRENRGSHSHHTLARYCWFHHSLSPPIHYLPVMLWPDLLLDLWHGGPFPARAFVGQACLFICVSALSCLGCVCFPETSSAAINTMYLEMKWISYEKAHSWKVVFLNLNIRECKASLMKLALKYNENNVLKHSWKIVFFNIHECIKSKW